MNEVFRYIKVTRRAFINFIDSLSVEELNKTPDGYTDNIIWNFGHIVISAQALAYLRTGIVKDESVVKYLEEYKNGSRPTRFVNQQEIDELKGLAYSTIDQLQEDYKNGKLNHIQPFSTMTYKEEWTKIEEVFLTIAGHDNLHFGYAKALTRAIQ